MRTLFIVPFWVGLGAAALGALIFFGAETNPARASAEPLLVVAGLALVIFLGLVGAPARPKTPVRARQPKPSAPRATGPTVPRNAVPPVQAEPLPPPAWIARWVPLARIAKWTPQPLHVALALAAATFLVGIATCSTTGGGSDSYGYVSQAQLWLEGQLRHPQPWVRHVPWENREWIFTPLAYRPVEGAEIGTVVPKYSPGLPMLMAVAKVFGGVYGMFAVVPLSGGLLVLVTYLIGARFGMRGAGLAGALLVASSPAFLFMLGCPMTDVPVAAGWAWAFYGALGSSRWSALGAGLVAGISILIRPNLVYEAGVIGSLYLFRAARTRANRRSELVNLATFALGVAPGLLGMLLINHFVYGSISASTYGSLSGFFSLSHVVPNLKLYPAWFAETQTPIAFLGVLALAVPVPRIWPGVTDRSALLVMAGFVAGILAMYLVFMPWDAWWYLRYVLAVWPFVMLGVGAFATALWRRGGWWMRAATVAGVIALAMHGYALSRARGAFDSWRAEGRYVAAGRIVRENTAPNSVVISMQHSGSLRAYSGRMTMRYEYIPGDRLDQIVEWLAARGVHTYAFLDEWEVQVVKRQFQGQRLAERFETPRVIYRGPGTSYFYDLALEAPSPWKPRRIVETYENLRFVEPGPFPTLALSP